MSASSSKPDARLREAAMAALQAVGGEMQIVNLNKALFYIDLFALRDFGHTITGSEYLALPKGPVVKGYERHLVKGLARAGLAVQDPRPDGFGKPMRVTKAIEEFETLTEDMLKIIHDVSKAVVKRTAGTVSDFSHKNIGWKIAYGDGRAGTPINLRIALQQLPDLDGDKWLDAAASENEKTAIASADDEDGMTWG